MSLLFFSLIALAAHASGSQFLKAQPKEGELVSEDEVRASFLAEVEGASGSGGATSRVRLLEAILKPMYAALPKNEHGKLGHSTVRYALHRLFILRHGWRIKGLARDTDAFNVTSPAGVLKGQVPAYIQDIFEKRLGNKGLGLQELAVMAATMEQLIHREAVGKLGQAYNISEISPFDKIDQPAADHLLDIYMMVYIIEDDLSMLNAKKAAMLARRMHEFFSSWNDTQAFVRRIRSNITGDPSRFDFSMLSKVVEVVGEEFGTFQDIECGQIKNFLMTKEVKGTGRVRLVDFWKPHLEGNSKWSFRESIGYLRQLGALDDSDPNDMSVIIPNYVHAHTNCIARSGYYAVCCKDECESLFGHLEEQIASSEAAPSTIAALVESLPSSTAKAPRKLSTSLLKRLEDIASEHAGMVPIHGRLFAQWLHHAYPRECPYPHESGTVLQQKPSEFASQTGMNQYASKEDMREYMSAATLAMDSITEDDAELMQWSSIEELLVERPTPVQTSSSFAMLRPFVLMAFCGSLAFSLVQSFEKTRVAGQSSGNAKYIV